LLEVANDSEPRQSSGDVNSLRSGPMSCLKYRLHRRKSTHVQGLQSGLFDNSSPTFVAFSHNTTSFEGVIEGYCFATR